MIREYDMYYGIHDNFNKEVYASLVGGEYPTIKSIEFETEFMLKLDYVEDLYYVSSCIPVYITIQEGTEDIVHLVLLNEYVYLESTYDTEEDFNERIKEIESELRASLLV